MIKIQAKKPFEKSLVAVEKQKGKKGTKIMFVVTKNNNKHFEFMLYY